VGEDQRRPPHPLDDLGHRERLSGTGNAQQNLVLLAVDHTSGELFDGRFLVSFRLVIHREVERHIPPV